MVGRDLWWLEVGEKAMVGPACHERERVSWQARLLLLWVWEISLAQQDGKGSKGARGLDDGEELDKRSFPWTNFGWPGTV